MPEKNIKTEAEHDQKRQASLLSRFVSDGTVGADERLETSAITANPFALQSAMAVALPSGQKASAIECWNDKGEKIGIWPMRKAHLFPAIPAMRVPNLPLYETAGTPMIQAGSEEAVLESMIHTIQSNPALPKALFNQSLLAEGPVWDALQAIARRGLIRLDIIESWERSVFFRDIPVTGKEAAAASLAPLERKSLRRRAMRLQDHGAVSIALIKDTDLIASAFERFCKIEASGWKGEARTALLYQPADTAFFKALLCGMATADRAFISELRLDDTAIASGLFLRCGKEITFLRTAYDQQYAAFSPGVLMDRLLTEKLMQDASFASLDASTDGSVDPASLIWPHRRRMAHVVIDCRGGTFSGRLLTAIQRMRLWLKQRKNRFPALFSR